MTHSGVNQPNLELLKSSNLLPAVAQDRRIPEEVGNRRLLTRSTPDAAVDVTDARSSNPERNQ